MWKAKVMSIFCVCVIKQIQVLSCLLGNGHVCMAKYNTYDGSQFTKSILNENYIIIWKLGLFDLYI